MHKIISKLIAFDRVEKVLKRNPTVYGHDFVNLIIEEFKINLDIKNFSKDNFSSTIFFSTHHSGAMDFLASFKTLEGKASNLLVLVNNKLMGFDPVAKVSIPTFPPSAHGDNSITREKIKEHLRNSGNLLVFPAEKVAGKLESKIVDSEWRRGIFEIYKESASCGVPIYIDANNGNFFYFLRKLFPKLSMLLLMRCLVTASQKRVRVIIGKETPRYLLDTYSPLEILQYFRNRTYELKNIGATHESELIRNSRREDGRMLARNI